MILLFLQAEHSKAQTLKIIDWIGTDPERLETLITIFLGDDYRLTQRSAWVVGHYAEKYPTLILPYLEQMLLKTQAVGVHDAVKRNVIRLLQNIEIPEQLLGMVVTICFDFLETPKEAVAIKAFSIKILAKIATQETDLQHELCLLIEDQMEHQSAGFRSIGGKILKKFKQKK
jgi:hypothetical protein